LAIAVILSVLRLDIFVIENSELKSIFRLKTEYQQHFVVDPFKIRKMIEAADIPKGYKTKPIHTLEASGLQNKKMIREYEFLVLKRDFGAIAGSWKRNRYEEHLKMSSWRNLTFTQIEIIRGFVQKPDSVAEPMTFPS
jgi:hypothetical protein